MKQKAKLWVTTPWTREKIDGKRVTYEFPTDEHAMVSGTGILEFISNPEGQAAINIVSTIEVTATGQTDKQFYALPVVGVNALVLTPEGEFLCFF